VVDRVILKPLMKSDKTHKDKLLAFVCSVLGTTPQQLQDRWDKATENAIGMQPITIGEDLTLQQVASIQAQSMGYPELNVNPVQRRAYPYDNMAAHTMGFIGEATEKDLASRKDLRLGDLIGKRGVELMYDNYLRGKDGAQYWEYDSHGRRLGEYRPLRKEPQAGDNIYLTLDFELQRRAEQYFIENEFVGAAVALDPRSGEILAMVSSPEFNPNVYSKRFTTDTYKTIASNPFKVELNRVIQGLYSPGSVFKTVMATAGLLRRQRRLLRPPVPLLGEKRTRRRHRRTRAQGLLRHLLLQHRRPPRGRHDRGVRPRSRFRPDHSGRSRRREGRHRPFDEVGG
jgi:penicillin-binding protein 2